VYHTLILKTISVIHRSCGINIGHYVLRTGTGLDELGPLGFNTLKAMVSDMTGESSSDYISLCGIYGFGPIDDSGVLICQDNNVRLFFQFEGAGTDRIPSLQDSFLRGASQVLLSAFRERLPLECKGLHETQEDTISEAVAHVIPTHDLEGVSRVTPTHEVKFPIKRSVNGHMPFSHQIRDFHPFGDTESHYAEPMIAKQVHSLVTRTQDVFPYWLGLSGHLSEYMSQPPHTVALLFGSSNPKSGDLQSFAHCVCFITAGPLSLRFVYTAPVDPFSSEPNDKFRNVRQMLHQL